MTRLLLVLIAGLSLAAASVFGCGGPGSPKNCREDKLYTEIHGDGIYTVGEQKDASRRTERLKREFERGGVLHLAERVDQSIDAIFKIAVINLKRRGHTEEAAYIERGWSHHRGTLVQIVRAPSRPIGSFEPLSVWLATAYEVIESTLGYEICRALRISDLKTYNYALRVVFNPCQYGLEEFTAHFVHDTLEHGYRGVLPVTSYWITSLGCSVATFGAGIYWLCSPIAMLVELGVDKVLAPWLAPKIYGWACEA